MPDTLQSQNALKPLSYCVRMAQMDLSDYSGATYEKLLQYAINGYKKLNYTTINSVKVDYLTMDSLNRIAMPNDMVDYFKIGIDVGGKLWVLGLNNNIVLPRDIECGDDSRDLFIVGGSLSSTSGYYFTDHFFDGNFIGGLFGHGGGFRESHYRLDWERRVILFDSNVPRSEIIIEYRSNGISAQTMIPDQATDCVVAFMHWRRLHGKNRIAELREAERIWKEELSELRAFTYQFKAKEYLDMLHEETHQSVKR